LPSHGNDLGSNPSRSILARRFLTFPLSPRRPIFASLGGTGSVGRRFVQTVRTAVRTVGYSRAGRWRVAIDVTVPLVRGEKEALNELLEWLSLASF
jgi:hypothetical protein